MKKSKTKDCKYPDKETEFIHEVFCPFFYRISSIKDLTGIENIMKKLHQSIFIDYKDQRNSFSIACRAFYEYLFQCLVYYNTYKVSDQNSSFKLIQTLLDSDFDNKFDDLKKIIPLSNKEEFQKEVSLLCDIFNFKCLNDIYNWNSSINPHTATWDFLRIVEAKKPKVWQYCPECNHKRFYAGPISCGSCNALMMKDDEKKLLAGICQEDRWKAREIITQNRNNHYHSLIKRLGILYIRRVEKLLTNNKSSNDVRVSKNDLLTFICNKVGLDTDCCNKNNWAGWFQANGLFHDYIHGIYPHHILIASFFIPKKIYDGKGYKEIPPILCQIWGVKQKAGTDKALYEFFRSLQKKDRNFPVKKILKEWHFSKKQMEQYFLDNLDLKLRFEQHFIKNRP